MHMLWRFGKDSFITENLSISRYATYHFFVDMIDGIENPPHPPLIVRLLDIDLF